MDRDKGGGRGSDKGSGMMDGNGGGIKGERRELCPYAYCKKPVQQSNREEQCICQQGKLLVDAHQPIDQDTPHSAVDALHFCHVVWVRVILNLVEGDSQG